MENIDRKETLIEQLYSEYDETKQYTKKEIIELFLKLNLEEDYICEFLNLYSLFVNIDKRLIEMITKVYTDGINYVIKDLEKEI